MDPILPHVHIRRDGSPEQELRHHSVVSRRSDGGCVRQAITTRWTYNWFVIPVAHHDRQRSDA